MVPARATGTRFSTSPAHGENRALQHLCPCTDMPGAAADTEDHCTGATGVLPAWVPFPFLSQALCLHPSLLSCTPLPLPFWANSPSSGLLNGLTPVGV